MVNKTSSSKPNVSFHTPLPLTLLGHLLGSDHDGAVPKNHYTYSVYKGMYLSLNISNKLFSSTTVPCPGGNHLFSLSVSLDKTSFSGCTKKMIDAEYERREKANNNCLYT